MNRTNVHIDREELAGQVARYLAAVDAFSEAGCHVTWRREARARARRAWTDLRPPDRSTSTTAG